MNRWPALFTILWVVDLLDWATLHSAWRNWELFPPSRTELTDWLCFLFLVSSDWHHKIFNYSLRCVLRKFLWHLIWACWQEFCSENPDMFDMSHQPHVILNDIHVFLFEMTNQLLDNSESNMEKIYCLPLRWDVGMIYDIFGKLQTSINKWAFKRAFWWLIGRKFWHKFGRNRSGSFGIN